MGLSGSKPPATCQSQELLSAMDVNASVALGVGQDPALAITNLAADHDPKLLVEAKRIYKDSKPPFLADSGNCVAGAKTPVFIAKNGQRPKVPIRSDLIARQWGPRHVDGIYWTLDLNGERFIVQAFRNLGRISGAEWVYCQWTAVGAKFEGLPLAFSCTNGEYTNVLSPENESTTVFHQSTAKGTTLTNAKANSLDHDPSRNFTPLVEDHPVEGLDRAKALYMDSRPLFVIRKTRNPRRRVLLAVQNGRFSAISTEAEVVYRAWDSLTDYPTLDLDGKRFIVMGSPGGVPAGYRYRFWLPPEAERNEEVIAYASQRAETIKTASGLTEHLSEADEGLDNEDDQDPKKGATVKEWYNYDGFRKAFDLTAIPPSRPIQFSLFSARQSIVPSEPSARKERPDRNLKPTKRARSATPPAQLGSRKGKAPDHAPKRTFHRTGYASDDCSGLSSLPHETPVPTPSINNRAAPSCETQDPQIQAPSSLPTLTLYKQTYTTLRATRNSNIIDEAPCWKDEGGKCSIAIQPVRL
ncbi:MAG: hypothetical protein Q9161_001770 [Pseudevernia consocians]